MLDLQSDLRALLIELCDRSAEFLIVGGYAVAFHGHVRATKDLDILVHPTPENAKRVFEALAAFGVQLGEFGVEESDLATRGQNIQIGIAPQRVDILTEAEGVDFAEAISNSLAFNIAGRTIRVIGIGELLRNKAALGRAQDLAEIAALKNLADLS